VSESENGMLVKDMEKEEKSGKKKQGSEWENFCF
jgi:hypothetical protein